MGRHTTPDLAGQKFHMLTAVRRVSKKEAGGIASAYLCRCDCGKERIVRRDWLKKGSAKSCGCTKYMWEHSNRKYETARIPSFNGLIKRYKNTARHRGIEWGLTFEEAAALFEEDCAYCGQAPSRSYNVYRTIGHTPATSAKAWIDTGDILYNGIDRIDSGLGYVVGNVCACCTACNFAKSTMSMSEFTEWVGRAFHHLKSKGLL